IRKPKSRQIWASCSPWPGWSWPGRGGWRSAAAGGDPMTWTKLTAAARYLALAGLLALAACDDGQQAANQVPASETGVGGPAAPETAGGDSTRHGPAARNGGAAAPDMAPAMPKAPITQSAYDFIDPGVLERPGYGLYTYVL